MRGILVSADIDEPIKEIDYDASSADPNTSIQSFVNGWIETAGSCPLLGVYNAAQTDHCLDMFVNEEGRLLRLPYNLRASLIREGAVFGHAVIVAVRLSDGEAIDVPENFTAEGLMKALRNIVEEALES